MAKRKSDEIMSALGPSLFGGEDKFKQTPNGMDNLVTDDSKKNKDNKTETEDFNEPVEIKHITTESENKENQPDQPESTANHNKPKNTIKKNKNKKKDDSGFHTTTATFSKSTYKRMKLISIEYDMSLKDIITECVEEGIKKYKL